MPFVWARKGWDIALSQTVWCGVRSRYIGSLGTFLSDKSNLQLSSWQEHISVQVTKRCNCKNIHIFFSIGLFPMNWDPNSKIFATVRCHIHPLPFQYLFSSFERKHSIPIQSQYLRHVVERKFDVATEMFWSPKIVPYRHLKLYAHYNAH